MKDIVWLNTDYYSTLHLVLFLTGGALWAIGYIAILIAIYKKKFVEMPATVLAANIAWEFLWSFIFPQNMGMVVKIGYTLWFVLDLFIVYGFYRYGAKQVEDGFKKGYAWYFTFGILAWLVFTYFFVAQGFDNPIGARSAYVSNLLISALYITQFMRLEDKSVLSLTTCWTKGLGTGLITVMCILRWPEDHWTICMGALCFIMDIYYFKLLLNYKWSQKNN